MLASGVPVTFGRWTITLEGRELSEGIIPNFFDGGCCCICNQINA